MRECTIQLGGENKIRVHVGNQCAPGGRDFRLDVAVKRGVDLDGVEIFRIKLQRWPLQLLRIELSIPVFVLPPGGADVDATHSVSILSAGSPSLAPAPRLQNPPSTAT